MDNEIIIEALREENEALKRKLALHFMDGTPEDKRAAEELFNEQRDLITVLEVENAALKQSRDEYQFENYSLKRRIVVLEKKLKA